MVVEKEEDTILCRSFSLSAPASVSPGGDPGFTRGGQGRISGGSSSGHLQLIHRESTAPQVDGRWIATDSRWILYPPISTLDNALRPGCHYR